MPRKYLEDLFTKKPMKYKPTPIINIDDFENTPQNYKQEKIAGAYKNKYIQYKSENYVKHQLNKIKPYLGNIIAILKHQVNGKFI